MSDHISGPRALADPIADITDVYAFPSPERRDKLVLVLNTLPFAKPSDAFSDGLVYRFRLRPLTATAPSDPAPFRVGGPELVFDCVFSAPVRADGGPRAEQEGTCTAPTGETVSVRVNDEQGSSANGVRVFAGPRWDPFIMDAPAALKTIATGKLAFTDPGSIFLDGKNVLSLVVEVDSRPSQRRGTGRRRRRDADPWQLQRSDRTGRAPGGQEHDAGDEAVRSGEPRPRDSRPVQHGGRVSPRRHLPRRLPRDD